MLQDFKRKFKSSRIIIKGITGVTARNFIIKIPQQKYEQFNIGQFMYHADKLITLHQCKLEN